jgi:hypothetical protein
LWNFSSGRIRVRAHVRYEAYGAVKLLDGKTLVSMRAPPKDSVTIASAVELFLHEDPRVRREARAALLIIGGPALSALERAATDSDAAGKFSDAARLGVLMDVIRQLSGLSVSSR